MTVMIKTLTDNEVLAKIEMIPDEVTRSALKALFWMRLAEQQAVRPAGTVTLQTKGSSS
jgi:hypothetical protein